MTNKYDDDIIPICILVQVLKRTSWKCFLNRITGRPRCTADVKKILGNFPVKKYLRPRMESVFLGDPVYRVIESVKLHPITKNESINNFKLITSKFHSITKNESVLIVLN